MVISILIFIIQCILCIVLQKDNLEIKTKSNQDKIENLQNATQHATGIHVLLAMIELITTSHSIDTKI